MADNVDIVGFAVEPKTDCPHVFRNAKFPHKNTDEVLDVHRPCADCGGTEENWLCLTCHRVGCSRYQHGHMAAHYDAVCAAAGGAGSSSGASSAADAAGAEGARAPGKPAPSHCIVASFSDMSIFCYECDSYITHPALRSFLSKLYKSKFGVAAPGDADSSSSSSDVDTAIAELRALSVEEPAAPSVTVDEIAAGIRDGKYKNIVFVTGAGISTAAGIPDFRSPGTGLYDNLQKYNLPHPTAVFAIDFFRENPAPFYMLAKELFPGQYKPTRSHYFIKMLADRGLVRRVYTQNIDNLERLAGVGDDVMIECHGSFAHAHCIDCATKYSTEAVKEYIMRGEIMRCTAAGCGGLVKPAIVFFGESLPEAFGRNAKRDMEAADLVIVMGTSLTVAPVKYVPNMAAPHVPRLVLNKDSLQLHLGTTRPLAEQLGSLDESVDRLVDMLGWREDFDRLRTAELHEL